MHDGERTKLKAERSEPGRLAALCRIVPCVFFMALTSVSAEIIDRVLAVVGGVVITLSDVNAAYDLGVVTSRGDDDRTASALSQLIDRQLILSEVDRYSPPEPTEEAVDGEVQAVRARFGSTESYNSSLTRLGLDDSHVRQTLRDELRIRAYLTQRFTVPSPEDEELNRYYREHLGAFTQGGQAVPFETARAEIARTLIQARRAMSVEEWVSGLRRRADITDLYMARR